MKKTVWLSIILAACIMLTVLLMERENRVAWFEIEESRPVISLVTSENEEILKPWFNKRDGLYYFFLPSYVPDNRIYCGNLEQEIKLDGNPLLKSSGFTWEAKKIHCISCDGKEYNVLFMKSSNIPALYVETESGTMEYLDDDKELQESGKISVVNSNSDVEYQGELKKISARGNSTYGDSGKKAYSFSLNKSYPLCGMDAGKKWNLLAMYFEQDKIHTKLLYDMADVLGMEYNIDCTWVDLYCNGEYKGLYLLTEAVTVGNGRVNIYDLEDVGENIGNITGGYLLEKDIQQHMEEEGNGFVTEQCGYPFIIKSPYPASEEQINYIKTYIQKIEDLVVAGDEKYKEYIDIDSFAKQFLIDKIVLDPDAMNMSTFFYKDINNDVLKAGPLWDYDRAFGASLAQYTLGIEGYPNAMKEWYMKLYEEEEFKDKVVMYYKELLPFMDQILKSRIDKYVAYVTDAVNMDSVMWATEYNQNDTMYYHKYENYVKYLKYFLANRLNYLNQVWGISEWYFETPFLEEDEHEVLFIADDGSVLETRMVADGSVLAELPALDDEKYQGWGIEGGGQIYSSYIPVYEDIQLRAKRKFSNLYEIADYRLERLFAAEDIQTYMEALNCEDLSVCIYIGKNSLLKQKTEVLDGIKAICDYKHPDWLDKKLESENNYFLLADKGNKMIWNAVNGELRGLITTFGKVDYSGENEPYLHIQENGVDYLADSSDKNISFVVINRYTGEIADIKVFH